MVKNSLAIAGVVLFAVSASPASSVSPHSSASENRSSLFDLTQRAAKFPGDFILRFELAETRIRAGERLEAVVDLRAILRDAPPAAAIRSKAAHLLSTLYRAEAASHATRGDSARAKRWATAAGALEPGENHSPLPQPSAQYRALIARARAAIDARAPSDALAALNALSAPLSAEAYALRAHSWLLAGRKDNMVRDLERAVRLDPSNVAVKKTRNALSLFHATELAERGESAKALETLDGADPAQTTVLALRARLRLAVGDTPGALADYEAAADRDDASAILHAALAKLYVAMGLEDRLYDRFGVSAEGSLPRDVGRLKDLAARRLARGDTASAALCYRRVIELDAADPEPWAAMAALRAAAHEHDKAVFNYRESARRGGRGFVIAMAESLLRAGRASEAGAEVLRAARDSQTPITALDDLRSGAKRLGLAAILATLDRVVLERRGDRDALARLMADECEARGDARGALRALSGIARRDTATERRILSLARSTGNDTLARGAFRALSSMGTAFTPGERLAMSRVELRAGAAQAACDLLSGLPKENREAARVRAEALLNLGRADAAIEALVAAGLKPDSSLALIQARRAQATGNAPEVVRLFQSAWGFSEGWTGPDYLGYAAALRSVSGAPAALEVLKRGIQRYPADAPMRRSLAALLAERGAFDEALQHLRSVLDRTPDDADALRLRIDLLRRKGDSVALTLSAERLPSLGRTDTTGAALPAGGEIDRDLLILSAEGLAARGRNEEAVLALERAAKLSPLNADEELRMGDLQKLTGHDDRALAAWERAGRLEPSSRLWARIARLHAARDDLAAAEKAFETAVELEPRNALLVFEWARLLLDNDNPGRAAAILDRLPRGGPTEEARQIYRAVALLRSDRLDEVRNTRLDLSDSGVPVELRAEVAAAIGETVIASALYSRAIERDRAGTDRPNFKVYSDYSRFLLSIGNPSGALAVAKRLATLHPGGSDAWELRALVATRQGRLDEAIRQGRMALRIAPGSAGIRLTLAEALWRKGRHGEAMNTLEPALRVLPDGRLKARVLAAYGTAALSLGLLERASSSLAAASEMAISRAAPRLASQIAFNLAIAERRRGEAGRALSILEQNRLSGPDAELIRASALVDLDRVSDAIAILEGASPNSPVASLNYGILLRVNGMPADSVRVLKYLTEIWKGEALVHYHLARSLEAQGSNRDARGEYLAAADSERDPALGEVFRKEAARLLTAEE